MVEQGPFKPRVEGSIPSRPSKPVNLSNPNGGFEPKTSEELVFCVIRSRSHRIFRRQPKLQGQKALSRTKVLQGESELVQYKSSR